MVLPYLRYADFSGRSRRLEYWVFTLFYVLTGLFLVFAAVLTGDVPASPATSQSPGAASIFFLILPAVFLVGSIIPSIAVQVRRFHDQDKSGWMLLLTFLPFGGIIVFIFMCLEGTVGENGYGPDPKGCFDADVFA